ncbi:MAG TPA: hypothetical protein VMH30_06250 [Verrucomicrobiae bacterium]|nr:hypothetical protein [Verrucomicrobiae bacterium]
MKSFWQDSYDGAKDRRYGALFFATLLASPLAVAIGAMIYAIVGPETFKDFVVPALPGVGLLLVALICLMTRRLRKRRQEQLKYASLSRDELVKARSKLRSQMRPVGRRTPPPPDIDLKY